MKVNVRQLKQRLKIWDNFQQSDQGLTLIECLVAIVVLSAVIVSMTPPIFLAVATRVQNRKAEQSIQLAHGEIDKVRVLVEKGNFKQDQLPDATGITQANIRVIPGNPDPVPAPTSIFGNYLQSSNRSCSTFDDAADAAATAGTPFIVPNSQAVKVDVDGTCQPQYLVQTFRNQVQGSTVLDADGKPVSIAFTMGVRVYSIAAQSNLGSLSTQEASLQLTTGQGDQTNRPLAVLYSDISRGDRNISLDKYRCFKSGNCP